MDTGVEVIYLGPFIELRRYNYNSPAVMSQKAHFQTFYFVHFYGNIFNNLGSAFVCQVIKSTGGSISTG